MKYWITWIQPQKAWTWAGLRPIQTLWFDQPPVGGVQIGLFKTTRQRALSLSSGTPGLSCFSLPDASPLDTRPPRSNTDWKQPSRQVQDCAKAVTSQNQQHHPVIPTRLPGDVTQQRREPAEVPRATRGNPQRREPAEFPRARAKRDKGSSLLIQQNASTKQNLYFWLN